MKKKFGFGIIGTGGISLKHAAAIREMDNGELVAVCSGTEERATKAAHTFKVSAYSDIHKFLDHPGLDIVCICTASGNHLDPALAAAKAGKHLLMEKPIEINLERTDRLIAACHSEGVKLGVIFQNRFNADYLQLKQAVVEGRFGRLLMGNAYVNWYREATYYSQSDWRGTFQGDGGGAFINQGIHTIDLLLDIMGEVLSVFGQVKTVLYPIEGEDLGAAIVNFKNGALGNITAGTALYPGYPERLEIYGTLGSAVLEAGKIIQWNVKEEESAIVEPLVQSKSGASDPMAIGHALHLVQFEDMIQAIQQEHAPIVTGESARKSLALILAIYESSKLGKSIGF
jgi:predicted dehydrogenase